MAHLGNATAASHVSAADTNWKSTGLHSETGIVPPWQEPAAVPPDARLRESNRAPGAGWKIMRLGNFTLMRVSGKKPLDDVSAFIEKPTNHWCMFVLAPAPARHIGQRQLRFQTLAHPFENASSSSCLMVLVPERMIRNATRHDVPLTIVDVGLGALLIDFVPTLEQRLPGIKSDELPALAAAVEGMISGCLMHWAESEHRAQVESTKLQRARAAIEENLRSANLNDKELSRLLGMSRSSLYRLFEPFGGVLQYVRRQRLLKAHARLADVNNVTPVHQIAEEFCFYDPSSFSRAFKQEFGIRPTTVRARASRGFIVGGPSEHRE